MLNILYFAWVRERVGQPSESAELPVEVKTVGDLIDWQRNRGGPYAEAFAESGMIRVAVNQSHVGIDHPLNDGDEVAFFPPVTGG